LRVDIEEFYDENPTRRTSEELEFGRDWSDNVGNHYEVSWVHDTGELYVMGAPVEPLFSDGVGDVFVQSLHTEDVVVTVLATIPERAVVEQTLAGWSKAMGQTNSIDWVRDHVAHRVRSGGAEVPPSPDDAPEEVRGAE
jgi:hypothetical protein